MIEVGKKNFRRLCKNPFFKLKLLEKFDCRCAKCGKTISIGKRGWVIHHLTYDHCCIYELLIVVKVKRFRRGKEKDGIIHTTQCEKCFKESNNAYTECFNRVIPVCTSCHYIEHKQTIMERKTRRQQRNQKTLFNTKAEKYARYRWDYSPDAIQAILRIAGLTASSAIADIGAGTGILTSHFAGKVGMVFAVEPNAEMRRMAERTLAAEPTCRILDGSAEAIPLADRSVDLIAVAQAIHWFDPVPTRAEFLRILKPGGWLAVVRNDVRDEQLNQAVESLSTAENGVILPTLADLPEKKPIEFYFGHDNIERMVFPFSVHDDWETFFGALLSTSYMPNEDHPSYPNLEAAARQVFERFSKDGILEVRGETELIIGQPKN